MSEALLYELVKAEPSLRAKWFNKLPRVDRPFELVPNPSVLFRHEISKNLSCGLPSSHVRKINHDYTKLYSDPEYVINEERSAVRDEKRMDIQKQVLILVRMARRDVPKLFPELKSATGANRKALCERAELKVCHDFHFVREKAARLIIHSEYRGSSQPPMVDETWSTFRWLQVTLLFALHFWEKYPKSIRTTGGAKLKERLRHDALDAQYLMLGLLEGAFASDEKKLCRWWRMLNPEGKLYTTRQVPSI